MRLFGTRPATQTLPQQAYTKALKHLKRTPSTAFELNPGAFVPAEDRYQLTVKVKPAPSFLGIPLGRKQLVFTANAHDTNGVIHGLPQSLMQSTQPPTRGIKWSINHKGKVTVNKVRIDHPQGDFVTPFLTVESTSHSAPHPSQQQQFITTLLQQFVSNHY